MKSRPKSDKPNKPFRRDPVDVIYDFEQLEELAAESGWRSLHTEVLYWLKRTNRGKRGQPPKHYFDRSIDKQVMRSAQKIRKQHHERRRGGSEEALHEASLIAAENSLNKSRPKGKRLTAAAVRDRLTHPGKYRKQDAKLRPPRPHGGFFSLFFRSERD